MQCKFYEFQLRYLVHYFSYLKLTDIDDKIIAKMIAENKSLKEVTDKYTAAFFDDLQVFLLQILFQLTSFNIPFFQSYDSY